MPPGASLCALAPLVAVGTMLTAVALAVEGSAPSLWVMLVTALLSGGLWRRQNVTSHPEPTLGHRALAQRAGSAVGSAIPGLTAATLTGPLERFLQRHSRERQPLSWD